VNAGASTTKKKDQSDDLDTAISAGALVEAPATIEDDLWMEKLTTVLVDSRLLGFD